MSVIPLAEAKAFLDVIHSSDDAKLQALLNGAEQEALDFMNRESFGGLCPVCDSEYASEQSYTSSELNDIPDSVRTGILFALQGSYQASPDERAKLRQAAEVLWMPYRCGLGV